MRLNEMNDSTKELATRNGGVIPECEIDECCLTAWWQQSGITLSTPKVCAKHKERAVLDAERGGYAVYFGAL